jgi:integrase/recombinase XerD
MKQLEIKNIHYHQLLKSFSEWMEILGYAQTTVKTLPVHLREWFHFLESKNIVHITKVKQRNVSEFIRYLSMRPNIKHGGSLSSSQINKTIQAINTFANYLGQTGKYIIEITARQIENDSQTPGVLTAREIMELYDATFLHSKNNTQALGQRDRAMIAIFYGCGLRKDEGTRLNITDIDLVKKKVFVKKAKGNKQRYVPIAHKHAEDIRAYLEEGRNWFLQDNRSGWHRRKRWKKQDADSEAFFISQRGKRLSDFYRRLAHLKEHTSIEKDFSMHTLRHSIATHLLQSGMPIEEIAKFLGHSSLESTQIYTHIINHLKTEKENVEHENFLPLPENAAHERKHHAGIREEFIPLYEMD